MAQLSGRNTVTRLTSLEVLSDDEKSVISFERHDNGDIAIKTRLPYESYWNSKLIATVSEKDARLLGALVKSDDVAYSRHLLDDIPATHVQRDKPADIVEAELREKIAPNCTELDIERAKAANLAEERRNIELSMERDHALDKHVGLRIDGCPACGRAIYPGHGDGSLRNEQEQSTSDTRLDDIEELPF